MDGSSDEILPTTTDRKASMGQKEGKHSPHKGKWTRLTDDNYHAKDLVPNLKASGLIALHDLLLGMSCVCYAISEPLLFATFREFAGVNWGR
jgi:hypothetical protein